MDSFDLLSRNISKNGSVFKTTRERLRRFMRRSASQITSSTCTGQILSWTAHAQRGWKKITAPSIFVLITTQRVLLRPGRPSSLPQCLSDFYHLCQTPSAVAVSPLQFPCRTGMSPSRGPSISPSSARRTSAAATTRTRSRVTSSP